MHHCERVAGRPRPRSGGEGSPRPPERRRTTDPRKRRGGAGGPVPVFVPVRRHRRRRCRRRAQEVAGREAIFKRKRDETCRTKNVHVPRAASAAIGSVGDGSSIQSRRPRSQNPPESVRAVRVVGTKQSKAHLSARVARLIFVSNRDKFRRGQGRGNIAITEGSPVRQFCRHWNPIDQ